jgi:hypothetical protein
MCSLMIEPNRFTMLLDATLNSWRSYNKKRGIYTGGDRQLLHNALPALVDRLLDPFLQLHPCTFQQREFMHPHGTEICPDRQEREHCSAAAERLGAN